MALFKSVIGKLKTGLAKTRESFGGIVSTPGGPEAR